MLVVSRFRPPGTEARERERKDREERTSEREKERR